MEFDRAQEKFGKEPDIEGLVPSLKELSLQDLKEIPFPVLNELLKTQFPAGSNGESHKLLFDAIQRTVPTPEMQAPLELVLKSDGLWVRVCSEENAELYPEALELAAEFYLTEDRITHSLCPECEQKIRTKYKQQRKENITREIKAIKRRALDKLYIPTSEISAVAIEKETD
jgi:hypothetical protein